MPFVEFVYFVLVGLLSGFAGGMLGVGGGVIIVALLLLILTFIGNGAQDVMQHIVATSLACITVTSVVATWVHHRRNGVIWNLLKGILPGVLVGSIFGAYIAHLISSVLLERIFGVFLILLAVYLYVRKKTKSSSKKQVHRGSIQSLMGVVISFVASALGIGGGTFYVPLFLGYRMPMKNAVATSSACTFFNALVGTIVFIILGRNSQQMPYSLGYVYLPAFFFISIGIVFSTPIGARLAHKLPSNLLQRLFACLVLIIGILMVIS
jgi:uncharacterized protein